jgi:hypothetical protein
MASNRKTLTLICLLLLAYAAYSQQFNSVPLEHEAYGIISKAVTRGIIPGPNSAKPWQEAAVRRLLREILNAEPGLLSKPERDIVSAALARFDRKNGLDPMRGAYYREYPLKGGSRYSFDTGLSWESSLNAAGTGDIGSVNMGTFYLGGDIGGRLSYAFKAGAGFFKVGRDRLGLRPTPPYFDPKLPADSPGGADNPKAADPSPSYSLPAYFPYTFSKPWEAAVFKPSSLDSYGEWPDSPAFGYEIISEVGTSLADDRLRFRFGRMRRDWGQGENGASLFMNAQARPFMALEGAAAPADWMYFSFLTGALEYQKINDQWADADPFQNLFSLAMVEINIKNYARLDFGSSTVWPKRFDLGYIFPVNSNFLYQNNIGDFDNLALFASLGGVWPGVGRAWLSLFVDEANLTFNDFFHMDRQMYAFQGGVELVIPRLPFATAGLRYTKVEPYCYTHEYTQTPWHSVLIDTAYLNNGESLGYYLPPNSDEVLVRLESAFLPGAKAYLQYQLIRHGVDYGYGRVDGSSLGDKIVKDDNSKKYFLRDGVYEWDNVIKIGGAYRLRGFRVPVSLSAEAGLVFTRFSRADIDYTRLPEADHKDAGRGEGPYSFIGGDEAYKPGTRFICSLGVKIF